MDLPANTNLRLPHQMSTHKGEERYIELYRTGIKRSNTVSEYRIDKAAKRLSNILKSAKNNKARYFKKSINKLQNEIETKVKPLSGDIDSFLKYLATYDKSTDFQRQARAAFAELLNLPERQILFVSRDDAIVWGLAGTALSLTDTDVLGPGSSGEEAVTVTFSDTKGRSADIIVLKKDMLSDLHTLVALAHESAHVKQDPLAADRMQEPIIRLIVEGFWSYATYEILISVANKYPKLGEYLESLVHEEYEGTYQYITDYRRMLSRTFEDRLFDLVTVKEWMEALVLSGYPLAQSFVDKLIEYVGKEPVQILCQKGNIKKFRDALGHEKFDALKIFFRSWEEQAKGVGINFLFNDNSLNLATNLASKFILQPDIYNPICTKKLIQFTNLLYLPFAKQERGNADELRMVEYFIDLADQYIESKIDENNLREQLDNLILKLSKEEKAITKHLGIFFELDTLLKSEPDSKKDKNIPESPIEDIMSRISKTHVAKTDI